jgi:hypothetical protein
MFGNFHWPQTNFPDLKYYEDALVRAGGGVAVPAEKDRLRETFRSNV